MHQQLLDFFLSSSQTFYKNDTNFSSEITNATQQTRQSVGQYFGDLEKFENNVRRMGGLRPSGPLHTGYGIAYRLLVVFIYTPVVILVTIIFFLLMYWLFKNMCQDFEPMIKFVEEKLATFMANCKKRIARRREKNPENPDHNINELQIHGGQSNTTTNFHSTSTQNTLRNHHQDLIENQNDTVFFRDSVSVNNQTLPAIKIEEMNSLSDSPSISTIIIDNNIKKEDGAKKTVGQLKIRPIKRRSYSSNDLTNDSSESQSNSNNHKKLAASTTKNSMLASTSRLPSSQNPTPVTLSTGPSQTISRRSTQNTLGPRYMTHNMSRLSIYNAHFQANSTVSQKTSICSNLCDGDIIVPSKRFLRKHRTLSAIDVNRGNGLQVTKM